MNKTQVAVRTRTFSWADPTEIASHLGGRSGLDLLRAMISGELPSPPFMHMLGIERMEADEGKVVVVMPVQEFHYNPLGTVHGGILSTLLDTAAGCAVHSTLPSGVGYTVSGCADQVPSPGHGQLRRAALRGQRHLAWSQHGPGRGSADRREGAPGRSRHVDLPAVRDRRRITAGSTGIRPPVLT